MPCIYFVFSRHETQRKAGWIVKKNDFLDDKERINVLKKMFLMTKKNGYIVSIVPSGMHVFRKKMKEFNLGGYIIPEIDYTDVLMFKEMKMCGGEEIVILF